MSHCGICFVGTNINIDTGAVPDPDVLMGCMQSGFDEILPIAGQARHVVLPNRAS